MKNTKITATIYPYNRTVSNIVRYADFISKYEIVSTIVPNGFDIDGKDISLLEKREKLGKVGVLSFVEGIKACETLIVADIECSEQFQKVIIKNVIYAMQQKKDILSLYRFSESQEQLLNEMSKIYSVNYESYKQWKVSSLPYSNSRSETYAPIILVAGLNEDCMKFDLQLQLRKGLLEAGYKVSQIGTKHYVELFGFHSFPEFMFDSSLTINDRVVGLNTYVRDIEKKEVPEVIIIGIPGGLIPITEKIHQNYGQIAYEVGYALQADFSILITQPVVNIDMTSIFERVKFLLGMEPCCVAMSNIRLNQEATKLGYQGISTDIIEVKEVDEIVESKQNELNVPIVNISKSLNDNIVADIIVEKVEEYYKSMCIPSNDSLIEVNENTELQTWMEKIVYKLFPDLNKNLGIEQNWSMLRANEILYIIAEIAKAYDELISSEEISKGLTNSYHQFIDLLSNKIKATQ